MDVPFRQVSMLNEDPALGWYDSQGIVFVPVSVAEDPDRLAEVMRHESTHHRLACGTSYGLLQQAVVALRPVAWEAPSETWSALAGLLDRHSRYLQEAAATYCSLVVLDPPARAAAIERLPELYLSGYQRFAGLLDHRDLDAEQRCRIALAIAARCLDTAVVDDWLRLGLADTRVLAGYLEQAGNSPDRRLDAALDDLATLSDAEIAAWAVEPGHGEGTRSRVLEIAGDLGRRHGRDADLFAFQMRAWDMLGEQLRVSLWPGPGGSFGYDLDDLDPEWVDEVDFVIAEVNPVGEDLRFEADPYRQPADLPPGHVRLSMHCPDQTAAHVVTVPVERIPELWARHPSLAQATYSVSPLAFLLPETLKWLPTSKLVVFALGGGTAFAEGVLAIQRGNDAKWLYHAILAGRTWGIIAARPADRDGPFVLYPVLLSLWDEQLAAMTRTLRLTYEPSATRFFGSFPRHADVVRFQRVFAGQTYTPDQWMLLLAASWLAQGAPPTATAAQLARGEFPGAHPVD